MTRRQIKEQANRRRGEILKLRKQGLSMGAIGKLYGVTDERIRQILQANELRSDTSSSPAFFRLHELLGGIQGRIKVFRKYGKGAFFKDVHALQCYGFDFNVMRFPFSPPIPRQAFSEYRDS